MTRLTKMYNLNEIKNITATISSKIQTIYVFIVKHQVKLIRLNHRCIILRNKDTMVYMMK